MSTERTEAATTSAVSETLRTAALGRREYAKSGWGTAELLLQEAWALDCAAALIQTGNRTEFLRAMCPTWWWGELGIDLNGAFSGSTSEEHA